MNRRRRGKSEAAETFTETDAAEDRQENQDGTGQQQQEDRRQVADDDDDERQQGDQQQQGNRRQVDNGGEKQSLEELVQIVKFRVRQEERQRASK